MDAIHRAAEACWKQDAHSYGPPELSSCSTLASIGSCRRHSRHSTPLDLSRCANLVPAGTGSESLRAAMLDAAPHSKLITHDHSLRAEHVRNLTGGNMVRCFVISLRDPADRLSSGFRWEGNMPAFVWWSRTLVDPGLGDTQRSAGRFVDALRDSAHDDHAYASAQYDHSALRTLMSRPTGSHAALVQPPGSGSLFLVSQLDHLRGIDCGRGDVLRVVCTERFAESWADIRADDTSGSTARRSPLHLNERTGTDNASIAKWGLPVSLLRTGVMSPEALLRKSWLTAQQRSYVREELYPWDTALHALWCGGAGGPDAR